jgi:hypothetical protein
MSVKVEFEFRPYPDEWPDNEAENETAEFEVEFLPRVGDFVMRPGDEYVYVVREVLHTLYVNTSGVVQKRPKISVFCVIE